MAIPGNFVMLNRAAVAAFSLLLVSAAVALAHDTWLLPATLEVPVGQSVRVDLTSGMAFPADDFAILAERVQRADVRLAGTVSALARPRSAPRSLRYSWTPAAAGVATLAVSLAPKTLTLTPDKVAEYLDEINADASLRAAAAALPAPKRWRESYSKHAKSFVRVGSPARDSSWAQAAGLGLEIVPERDPTTLHTGDTLGVVVLSDGKPKANFAVGALHAGETAAHFSRTDARGRARVVLAQAGVWLLNGTDLRRTTKPGLEWESDFTTMTIAVKAKPPK